MSNDPFTDHALRPTTTNATAANLRAQASNTSLRSGAGSSASTRTRQQRELYAPSISRRAPSRALRRLDGEVLADSDSEADRTAMPANKSLRRVRALPANSRSEKHKQEQKEGIEIVIRQPDGSFIREIPDLADALREHTSSEEFLQEAEIKARDDDYAAIARQYFTSGVALGGARSRKHEEEYEDLKMPMMVHMRAEVVQKLDEERWRFESSLPT